MSKADTERGGFPPPFFFSSFFFLYEIQSAVVGPPANTSRSSFSITSRTSFRLSMNELTATRSMRLVEARYSTFSVLRSSSVLVCVASASSVTASTTER